jgi:5'(3')-deoxyribonucleotidase
MTLFLDMDDVLCDFHSQALKLHGRPDLVANWPIGVWDMAEVLGITTNQFWWPINEAGADWWASLPLSPQAKPLLKLANKFFKNEWLVCTSPSEDPSCVAGKVRWIQTYLKIPMCRVIFCGQKQLLSRPKNILVDDRTSNCDRWESAGGKVVRWPQRWNGRDTSPDGYKTALVLLQYFAEEL